MLSWVERNAAAVLFGTPPTSTVEEAIAYFEKAEERSSKEWKDNRLYLAKVGKSPYPSEIHSEGPGAFSGGPGRGRIMFEKKLCLKRNGWAAR